MNRLLLWLGFPHRYRSTGCLHGGEGHDYCAAPSGAAGTKQPARCKWCAAPCRCRCHRRGKPKLVLLTTGRCRGCDRNEPVLLGRIMPHPDRVADRLGVGPMDCSGSGQPPSASRFAR